MAEPSRTGNSISVEEYLQSEETATVRHEYVAGEVFALAGASDRHNRIALNIASRLLGASRGGPCRVYISDMKLRVTDEMNEDSFYYPDVMVVCEESSDQANPDFQREPCLLIEVLSPGTRSIDRREKLLVYRQLPSLMAYLIVDQDRRRVTRYWRDEAGIWQRADLVDAGNIPLSCQPRTELSLAEVYEGL